MLHEHENLVPAHLTLETREAFSGWMPANQAPCYGEVVFNTGMVGYTESLTDPSYTGQILVFTYPLIGNYGVSETKNWESKKIHVKGVVMSEMAHQHSNHTAIRSLREWLEQENIPYMIGADTRAITIRLREKGVIPGSVTAANTAPDHFENFVGTDWVKQVSIKEPQQYGSGKKEIIVVDCGIKENILRCLQQFPIRIKRVPYDYDYSNEKFDGIFISNGPGDPTHCKTTIKILQNALTKQKPVFGICLGTQLLALAINC